jgi:hypothetical protein
VVVVITRWFKEERGAPMGLAIAGTTVRIAVSRR